MSPRVCAVPPWRGTSPAPSIFYPSTPPRTKKSATVSLCAFVTSAGTTCVCALTLKRGGSGLGTLFRAVPRCSALSRILQSDGRVPIRASAMTGKTRSCFRCQPRPFITHLTSFFRRHGTFRGSNVTACACARARSEKRHSEGAEEGVGVKFSSYCASVKDLCLCCRF